MRLAAAAAAAAASDDDVPPLSSAPPLLTRVRACGVSLRSARLCPTVPLWPSHLVDFVCVSLSFRWRALLAGGGESEQAKRDCSATK